MPLCYKSCSLRQSLFYCHGQPTPINLLVEFWVTWYKGLCQLCVLDTFHLIALCPPLLFFTPVFNFLSVLILFCPSPSVSLQPSSVGYIEQILKWNHTVCSVAVNFTADTIRFCYWSIGSFFFSTPLHSAALNPLRKTASGFSSCMFVFFQQKYWFVYSDWANMVYQKMLLAVWTIYYELDCKSVIYNKNNAPRCQTQKNIQAKINSKKPKSLIRVGGN